MVIRMLLYYSNPIHNMLAAFLVCWQSVIVLVVVVRAETSCFADRNALNTAIAAAVSDGASGAGYIDPTYGLIDNWCFESSLTDFSYLFVARTTFNADISEWDVSSVTNMSFMFLGNQKFNQDIGRWNVSAVTDMQYMVSM